MFGCQHESDSDSTSPQSTVTLLSIIPEQTVVSGKTLTLTLHSETQPASITFSTDGTVGPDKNPYLEKTPATFDAARGEFAWTPTDAEAGVYSVRFVATDDTAEHATESQTVRITVYTLPQWGLRLFVEHCASCHGADATGLSAKPVLMKSRDEIATALKTVSDMAPLSAQFTDEQIDWLGAALASLRAHLAEHGGVDPSAKCGDCHDGEKGRGKSAAHIRTTMDCAGCHLPDAWSPTHFDHSATSGSCVSCHWSPFEQPPFPATHIAATTACGSCHSTDAWKPVRTVDHSQVIGTCASCHDGTAATARSVTHISTTSVCDSCHFTSAWSPVVVVDHKQVVGTCVSCHDGTTARGVGELHTFSDNECYACHSTVTFVPVATMDHSHLIVTTCATCHGPAL